MKKILIVEDDRELNEGIAFHIKKTGYQPIQTYDLRTAGLMFREEKPDLILLDVCLPDGEGFQFCRQIKAKRDIPILFITARDLEEDALKGYEYGADDYVIKPFSPKELEARVKAVLRRTTTKEISAPTGKTAKNVITTGQIKIDTARRQVYRKNERIRLTGMEFSLLELLVNNSGQAYSRNEILQHVWAYPPDHRIDTRVVDVHISRLRSKLEADPANPELILTARGIGYMFQRIN